MEQLIESVSHGVPATLSEVITLGRTLKKRAATLFVARRARLTASRSHRRQWLHRPRLWDLLAAGQLQRHQLARERHRSV